MSRLRRWAQQVDQRAFDRVARSHPPLLDSTLPRLTRVADHGVLWLATAAALAASGPTGRRAATRGLMSLGLASAVTNGPAKLLSRRNRPSLVDVPSLRLLAQQPWSSSFPSGHSASAAAFTTGAALAVPPLAPPLALLGGAVAYSRVYTGVHYPGDVLAGAAVGVGAALVVRRVWPVRPARASARCANAHAPALPDGAGLVVVVNETAGSADADDLRAALTEELPAAEVVGCGEDDDLEAFLAAAAARATVLGVSGGDGTVNCAAQQALRHGRPLAVLPGGTLNHFAADLGVDDVAGVAAAVRRGDAVEVTVGSADPEGHDLVFLNTFSVGIYPELVRRREARERWLGKWPALAVAIAEVTRSVEPFDAEVDGTPRLIWTLFAGNGRYHPAGFAPTWRERLDEGRLDLRVVDADRRWARTRLVVAVMSGRLGRCRVYSERVVERVRLRLPADAELARDGEVQPAPRDLVLSADSNRLVVYRPAST